MQTAACATHPSINPRPHWFYSLLEISVRTPRIAVNEKTKTLVALLHECCDLLLHGPTQPLPFVLMMWQLFNWSCRTRDWSGWSNNRPRIKPRQMVAQATRSIKVPLPYIPLRMVCRSWMGLEQSLTGVLNLKWSRLQITTPFGEV